MLRDEIEKKNQEKKNKKPTTIKRISTIFDMKIK